MNHEDILPIQLTIVSRDISIIMQESFIQIDTSEYILYTVSADSVYSTAFERCLQVRPETLHYTVEYGEVDRTVHD